MVELSKNVPRRTENLALLHFFPFTLLVHIQYHVLACFEWRILFPHNRHCCEDGSNPSSVRKFNISHSLFGSHNSSKSVNDILSVFISELYIARDGCLFCMAIMVQSFQYCSITMLFNSLTSV